MSADLSWPAGVAKRILDEVDSTNAEAMRIASEISGPTWILAKRQTAARGRRGRAWANPEGNFAGTLVMRPIETPDLVALRSFVTALALRDALVLATGRPEAFALKWPNDVLLNGGKLAGILLETTGQVGALTLAIGIGVNLAEAPPPGDVEPGALAPVSVAGETGIRISPEEFLDLLAACYAKREASFATHGFEPIRTAWLASAAHLGAPIRARTLTDEFHGTFEGIGPDGALILTTGSGPLHLPAADVYF
ncbi:biotin--[acetyl-CoA-carboxylase] ligase [Dinoroseobacter sp. S76]|uniref:biotin--[acetyl-CoA-carboxylase] ligase n=1 Tax=Dinoroseobacter sp. S76 TaxID=3415124 RepID=UPI003C7E9888